MDPFTLGYGEFQGIPKKTLPEDTVQYFIYAPNAPSTSNLRSNDYLIAVKEAAEKLYAEWGREYIWQRDGFKLEFGEETVDGEEVKFLTGSTEFGDAIDDEWFIVAMLRELSRQFESAWIRVIDTDGEFLLIEAANALPSWVKPEVMDRRVWINSGQLMLITEKKDVTSLTISEAHEVIRSGIETKVQRLRLVEEEAFYRISKYPQAAMDHLHYALAKVPRQVALVLSKRPQYISAAVEQFYLRDPINLKACKAMNCFPASDLVKISIRFSKVLYAQLRSQEFDPPSGSGFKLPPKEGDSAEWTVADVGMKVACGFEMLIAPEGVRTNREDAIADDIKTILESGILPSHDEIAAWPRREDPDTWLDIDYTEFEQNLQGKSGRTGRPRGSKQPPAYGHKATEEKLKKMVERFEAFLNDETAGLDGIDLEGGDTTGNDSESSSDSEGDGDEEDVAVSFNEAEFEMMMREMMGLPPGHKDAGSAEAEEVEIRKVMSQVETELKEAGVMDPGEQWRITELDDEAGAEDGSDEDVDIDINLARNMLESFKSQTGMAGPGGNLLASMGIVLPRDEDDGRDAESGEFADDNIRGKGKEKSLE